MGEKSLRREIKAEKKRIAQEKKQDEINAAAKEAVQAKEAFAANLRTAARIQYGLGILATGDTQVTAHVVHKATLKERLFHRRQIIKIFEREYVGHRTYEVPNKYRIFEDKPVKYIRVEDVNESGAKRGYNEEPAGFNLNIEGFVLGAVASVSSLRKKSSDLKLGPATASALTKRGIENLAFGQYYLHSDHELESIEKSVDAAVDRLQSENAS